MVRRGSVPTSDGEGGSTITPAVVSAPSTPQTPNIPTQSKSLMDQYVDSLYKGSCRVHLHYKHATQCIFDLSCFLATSCLCMFFFCHLPLAIMHRQTPVSRLTDLVSSVRRPTAPQTDTEASAASRPLTAPVSAPSHPSPSPAQPSSSPLPSAHCEYVVSVSVLALLAQQHEFLFPGSVKRQQ